MHEEDWTPMSTLADSRSSEPCCWVVIGSFPVPFLRLRSLFRSPIWSALQVLVWQRNVSMHLCNWRRASPISCFGPVHPVCAWRWLAMVQTHPLLHRWRMGMCAGVLEVKSAMSCISVLWRNFRHTTHLCRTEAISLFPPMTHNPASLRAPSVKWRPWCLTSSWYCRTNGRETWLFLGKMMGFFSGVLKSACLNLPPTDSKLGVWIHDPVVKRSKKGSVIWALGGATIGKIVFWPITVDLFV